MYTTHPKGEGSILSVSLIQKHGFHIKGTGFSKGGKRYHIPTLSHCLHIQDTMYGKYICDEKLQKLTQSAGFEPARAEPNGFLVHRLNHSATTAVTSCEVCLSTQPAVYRIWTFYWYHYLYPGIMSVYWLYITNSCRGRVVKAMDLKSIGIFPHRFEPCRQRYVFTDKTLRSLLYEHPCTLAIPEVNRERRAFDSRMVTLTLSKCFHMASMGIEPTTFALLARRSNQLS